MKNHANVVECFQALQQQVERKGDIIMGIYGNDFHIFQTKTGKEIFTSGDILKVRQFVNNGYKKEIKK
jgi:hypothetical protein